MDTSRMLELAGVKKSVGERKATILTEGRFDWDDEDSDIMAKLRGDAPRSKVVPPEEDEPVSVPKGWDMPIRSTRAASAKKGRAAPYPFKKFGRSAEHTLDAESWLRNNPHATRKDFVQTFTDLAKHHNPDIDEDSLRKVQNGARSAFDKMRKRLGIGIREWYGIRQDKSSKFLSERSQPLRPHWVASDDYDTGFMIFKDEKSANIVKESMLLHSDQMLEVVKMDEKGWD